MDIAIVTGASSSLGLAISRRLMQMGFRVYGLGGDYTDCPLNNVNFKPYPCELSDPDAVEQAARKILEKEKGVYVLVNNAKYFGRNDFFEMDTREMEQILRVNLLCPLVLARTLANSLMTLQGFLIQLGTPWAETSRGGPVGAAASGGLKWMGDVLFQDLRHQGVKVCHLSPEPNRGRDPRSVARPGARTEATIDPEAVAQAIEQILQSPFGNIVTELVMRPLRVKEPEHDPVVRLPMPNPKPVPYTVPREFIEAEEQLEDEEIEKNLRQKRERRRSRNKGDAQAPRKEQKDSAEPGKTRKPERKPARKPEQQQERKPERQPESKPERQPESKAERQPEQQPQPGPDADGQKSRRKSRRKPRPPKAEVGFLDKLPQPEKADKEPQPGKADPQEAPKKAARKTTKKAARKKTAARKAPAKKTAAKKAATKKSARKSAVKKPAQAEDSDGKSG